MNQDFAEQYLSDKVYETTTIEQNKILYTCFPSTEHYISLSSTEDSNSQEICLRTNQAD